MEMSLYNDDIIKISNGKDTSTSEHTISNKCFIQLESTLLDLAATEDLCSGVLYMFPVKLGQFTIIR